jgi:hypothetical protein
MREAVGRYRTATQSTPDVALRLLCLNGLVLGHSLHNMGRFWVSLPAHPCSRLSRRVDRKLEQDFYNWAG